jgi:type IV pilus assembly protein PilB
MSEKINIITLEDPVEYEVEAINQVQINEKVGLTFAKGLRTCLRQDPDVIMVGEMRDRETSEIAMRASLTGHLVLSTLHTNDAVSTITRLLDMGIPPYLIASALTAIVSQRLVRGICPKCKVSYKPTKSELEFLKRHSEVKTVKKLFKGKGCDQCNNSGYFDRLAVFEILIMDKALKDLISLGKDEELMKEAAGKGGMTLLWDDAIDKVVSGNTTVEEIERCIQKSNEPVYSCESCGGQCQAGHVVCPHCGYQRFKKCLECHSPLEDEWRFCPACTSPVELKY